MKQTLRKPRLELPEEARPRNALRADIAPALGRLISSPGVEISDTAIYLDALDRYRKTRIHFVDCLIAATAVARNIPVATFDQDFRKFGDVHVGAE